MSHYECELSGDAEALIAHLDAAIIAGSVSANIEDGADRRIGDARMVVRVYERYSAMGGNRVSLSIAVLAVGQQLAVSAITSGGSQAVFWKLNTFGEEAFMEKAKQALASFTGGLPPAHGTENALL
ncbi:DUF6054 family protein [Nocardioides marmorisolisilvae]|uniref:Uncharacterized protein n=1 Tax=Nocardioides marmorisolisilvae TaxID=1542737 RepID=A0A3N0DTF1_9ACTN|nr:DUF6054 family protein [Nocardioides marmorisolisilvae]RNL78880.1 hypothetical protein EFL95_07415 [Nocardioides marmorisolisilvae]